jgi:hypothetical protein
MQIIQIQAVPAQMLQVTLSGQSVQISLYQKTTGLFCDVSVNNSVIVTGVICQNLNRIVRDVYRGFVGDLAFLDQQGTSDPTYDLLGTRYLLLYLAPGDL